MVATVTDANYTGSASGTLVIGASTSQDFSFAPGGSTAQTVLPGQTATFTFALSPQFGSYGGPIAFSAAGFPAAR